MLTQIELHHFKCFESLLLGLRPLTLLTGTNASGKSSVMHSLLLLHQTMREHEWSNRLLLNGRTIELGTVADVVDKTHGRNSIEIGVTTSDIECKWRFSGDRMEMSMGVDSVSVRRGASRAEQENQPETLRFLLPVRSAQSAPAAGARLARLTYVSAERVGPREFYRVEDPESAVVVGPAGEQALSLLHIGRDEPVIDALTLPDAPPRRLRQVDARLQRFFAGCAIDVQPVPQANAVTLGIRTSNDTDFHRPINAGFGVTQVLPIIIAALSAKPEDILLVENPEVHLHPAAQAQMGSFLADVARAGVQTIIETHSDHVLNGIRRAVRDGCLEPDQVAIHFFRPRTDRHAQVVSPIVDMKGQIDAWPDGFFDQFDEDSNALAGWDE